MAYKLAIAISGAVSLGSYEAGVVFEVVRAIAQHNQRHASAPEKQILIDVLTGASAGGMTVALLAQKLLYEKEALEGPIENCLYQAWVKEVDIKGLLNDEYGDDPRRSIFSSNFVATIARKLILQRYDAPSPHLRNRHPAAADSIRLGLAIANLNGVDYSVPTFKNIELDEKTGEFIQTRFQDSFTCSVTEKTDNEAFWQQILLAACACGAFPFAFTPRVMSRTYKDVDYSSKGVRLFAETEGIFSFTDGGIFDNYPLGMAKNLVNQIDKEPLDYQNRFYLYISPNSKESARNVEYNGDRANMLETGLAVAQAIFNQSRFQDWVTTDRVNKLIEQLDHCAYGLRELIRTSSDDEIQALDKATDILLSKLDIEQTARREAFDRLKEQYLVDEEAETLAEQTNDDVVNTWIKAVQVLEVSGRLHDKDYMNIYTITASKDELAGEGVSAFMGFLDQEFRDFDYNVGRDKARGFLRQLQTAEHDEENKAGPSHLPLKDFTISDPLPECRDLSGADMASVKEEIRKKVYKRACKRLEQLLKDAGLGWFARMGIMLFAPGKIKKIFRL